MKAMRHTLWTLLCALLLQVLGGSAWAVPPAQARAVPAACHESVAAPVTHAAHAAHATHASADDEVQAAHLSHSSHHCCAVGLGVGLAPATPPLPQSTPVSTPATWASLCLRPDLRPPI